MPNKCSAFGCKSGYASNQAEETILKITSHSYPLANVELCENWLRANPRKDFTPSKNSKVCSLHFRDEDFVEISNDNNNRRRRKKLSVVFIKQIS